MSGFFSPKFLKYRNLGRMDPIEGDLACANCGYNLRGLNYGRNCPECGTAILPEGAAADAMSRVAAASQRRGALQDVLLSGGPAQRRRWRIGLGAAFVCVVVAVVARLLLFFVGFTGISGNVAFAYVTIGLVTSVVWVIAAWMVTPRSLDRGRPSVAVLRSFARLTQLLWPLGYVLWLIALGSTSRDPYVAQRAVRFIAGLGAVVLAFLLSGAAGQAERDNAERRLNAAGWLLPIVSLIPQAFPANIAWFTLVLLAMFLGLWAWVMTLLALGLLELQRHVAWAETHAADLRTRPDRIAQTRAEADRRLEEQIRPLGPDLPEVPFEE